jgi:hypothetical protein
VQTVIFPKLLHHNYLYRLFLSTLYSRYFEYSTHTLNTAHRYGTMVGAMDIMTTYRKGKHLKILKKYDIHEIGKSNLQMIDTNIDTYNPIFGALQVTNIRWKHKSRTRTISNTETTQYRQNRTCTLLKSTNLTKQNPRHQLMLYKDLTNSMELSTTPEATTC